MQILICGVTHVYNVRPSVQSITTWRENLRPFYVTRRDVYDRAASQA